MKKCLLLEWSPKDDLKFFSERTEVLDNLSWQTITLLHVLYEAYRTRFFLTQRSCGKKNKRCIFHNVALRSVKQESVEIRLHCWASSKQDLFKTTPPCRSHNLTLRFNKRSVNGVKYALRSAGLAVEVGWIREPSKSLRFTVVTWHRSLYNQTALTFPASVINGCISLKHDRVTL